MVYGDLLSKKKLKANGVIRINSTTFEVHKSRSMKFHSYSCSSVTSMKCDIVTVVLFSDIKTAPIAPCRKFLRVEKNECLHFHVIKHECMMLCCLTI